VSQVNVSGISMDENSASVLLSLLDRAVLKCVGDAEYVDVAFSGGLDSSLIAVLAKKHAKVKGYSIGMKESHDAQWCAHAASLIGICLLYTSPSPRD